jgi:2',3'-cyclic-nucleotide 2'-phosphodiesterase (5'-nucleotidase family)
VVEARQRGPALLVDAGDALFAAAADSSPGGEARARLLLQEMGRMRYAALAVGERDLARGPAWLAAAAAAAGVPLLAANVAGPDGRRPFGATALAEAGGRRVGILAVVEAGALPGGLVAADPIPAARAAVAELRARGAELVVALLHLGAPAARRLLAAVSGIDVAVRAHDGLPAAAEVAGGAVLVTAMERARSLGRLEVEVASGADWANRAAPDEAREELLLVEASLRSAEARARAASSEEARAAFGDLLEAMRGRAERLRRAAASVPHGRLYRNALVPLDPRVPEDAGVRRAVEEVLARHGDADAAAAGLP